MATKEQRHSPNFSDYLSYCQIMEPFQPTCSQCKFLPAWLQERSNIIIPLELCFIHLMNVSTMVHSALSQTSVSQSFWFVTLKDEASSLFFFSGCFYWGLLAACRGRNIHLPFYILFIITDAYLQLIMLTMSIIILKAQFPCILKH